MIWCELQQVHGVGVKSNGW